MSALPKTKAVGENLPVCPWCGTWMDDATVKLDDVFASLMANDGSAYIGGLEVDCPECGKPSKFDCEVRGDEARSWLTGERTPADKKLLGEPL